MSRLKGQGGPSLAAVQRPLVILRSFLSFLSIRLRCLVPVTHY